MQIETFLLERNQTLFENNVEFNLTESGIHPCSVQDILDPEAASKLLSLPLGYGYTEGRPALRDAIATWYPGAARQNIAVTHGTSEANLLAILSVLSPGDEVLVLLPNFMQIPGLTRALGVNVKRYILQECNDWQPDPTELERLVDRRTRMIALANPNNPTGQVLSNESMKAIAGICDRHGIYLLADEIYRGAEVDRDETPTFWGCAENVIVTSSLSKAFALPGLRLGWIVAKGSIISETMQRQDYTSIGTGILNQRLAEAAMQPATRERLLARSRSVLTHNTRILDEWLQRNAERMGGRRPQAGAIAFLRYQFPLASEDFSVRLREEESVFVVAGSWFGIDNHVRVGIGGDAQELSRALARMEAFMQRLEKGGPVLPFTR